MARTPAKPTPAGPMSPRMVSSLRFIARNGISKKTIRAAHQGTLGALGARMLINRYGLTIDGERELLKYPSDRVRRLLNYVETMNDRRRRR
jgi:hypothetical protein